MTQKELLYFEDAIEHEQILIKITEAGLEKIENKSLASFIQDELSKHTKIKEKLMNLLEEKQNE